MPKGQVLWVQNRCREAIPEYQTAMDSFPTGSEHVVGNLGWCKFLTGSIDEVIPLEEEAVRIAPDKPLLSTLYIRIGLVQLLQSRIPEAIGAFEKARAGHAGEMVDMHANLAAAYALKGETERTAAELAKARNLSHDGRYSSVCRLSPRGYSEVPALRALYQNTLFAGLRKAGMSEE
jgi:tetratricopeptide (TPR) repeat protein